MPVFEELFPGIHVHAENVRFYGASIQARMSVVPLSGGDLFVHSPLPLSPEVKAALDGLGRVAHVVSPNKIHNQGLSSYADTYPDARLYASPGLPERRPDLSFAAVLGDAPEPAWADVLDQRTTKGNSFFSEVVFFHPASRTLMLADLIENIGPETVAGASRLFCQLFGIYRRCLASPEFRFYTHDPAAAREAFDAICEWDFDHILMAHGTLVIRDAKAVFADVVDRLIEEVSRRPVRRQRVYDWIGGRQ